jgi:hypothetical protein
MEDFAAVQSDDMVKADLELTCLRCSLVLCDIEHDDTLSVLVSVATDHAEHSCKGLRP